jgi:predicted DNA binding CopG/RHH family protein
MLSKSRLVSPPLSRFVQVNARLFAEDVDWIKMTATAAGETNWQSRLRRLVHDALRSKGVVK